MTVSPNPSHAPTKSPPTFDAVQNIRIEVAYDPEIDSYVLSTHGMRRIRKPEFRMRVKEGIYCASASHILNDVAEYAASLPRKVRRGQRVHLAPWTVVAFRYDRDDAEDPELVIDVVDAVDKDGFH